MSDRADVPFEPISPNPFIVGNPVRGRTMFFGRQAEFDLVHRRFKDSEHGALLVFCGERRSGKTSILFQILDRRLGPDFIPVLIDMQSMAVDNEVDFLTRICEGILEALGADAEGIALPQFTSESTHSLTFQKFVRDIIAIHPGKKLVLLFDEYELFENKIDANQLSDDVLHILASLMENHPVFLIFTGSQHLEQRRREYWKILGKSVYKTISFLEPSDAVHLIRKPVEGRVDYEEETVESICRLTAGQPFYTQAICQSLVDHLNEERSRHASPELLASVVDGMVNNALPQMIFHWDGLERDEKLVLALIAEALPDENAWASLEGVRKVLRDRNYPLELDRPRIATTLEKLFKNDMLLRREAGNEAEYAFRMDLWRLWIRRMHSVWQVMREEGLEIRRRGLPQRARVIAWSSAGAVAIATVVVVWFAGRGGGEGGAVTPGPMASLALQASPEDALIYLDDRRVGMGSYLNTVAANHDHRFRFAAAGYADSEIVVRMAPGDSVSQHVELRPLLGDLRVETQPSGAQIAIDGKIAGKSPLTVNGLGVAAPHRVEAVLAGYGMARRDVTLEPNTVSSATLVLEVGKADVMITTDPSGSAVSVDGGRRGVSPLRLESIAIGQHAFSASFDGYVPAETTIAVATDTRQIHLILTPEPPGVLVVQGDRPATIYVDDVLVVENVPNSGPRSLRSGTHRIRVILVSGETIDKTVDVRPRERVVYDFTQDTLTHHREDGS